ncbi:DoxX family protein [Sediminibacterium roseum]|uniref:DoxX family protein n=1 Tax=Sediminibacterium roseum TaxID=1978412 RepID=A0ABW9ZZ12_9BACT|nr:DoxX family protein [Sediminibacterium roseum]NCI51795.1 DoxX family protein [Sediminibacterium roseum]
MSQKTRTIVGWSLTALVALVLLMSASMKLKGGEELARNAAMVGLTAKAMFYIGLLELVSLALFIIPRTGVLGTLLLAAYLGGAIVTHLEHGQPAFMPVAVQCMVWIAAVIRFPELGRRLVGKQTQ